MAIGDVFYPGDIQAWQLAEMCFECKLPQRQTARMLDSLCNNMLRSLTVISLPELLTPAEEGGYVALNPETGTTTQGETVEEAVANLKEATALYLLEFPLPTPGHPVITMFSLPADA